MVEGVVTPYIIPFFISHAGCPHQCVFCNQHDISGTSRPVTPKQIQHEITEVLCRSRDRDRPVQVAFYGGSFTGLEVDEQKRLLAVVQPFLRSGEVEAIRLSTRPDCLDQERVQLLLDHGVSLVELGVQSLDATVLNASGRGHGAADVLHAFSLLKENGLQVGGQLMVGLPYDTSRRSIQTCQKLIDLRPDCVRIYPTVVMEKTALNRLYQARTFQPWSLARTVVVVAQMKAMFDAVHIPVIRMGLQAGDSLQDNMVAGPYHPAFGELVLSRLFYKKMRRLIFESLACADSKVRLICSSRDQSLFMGMKKENYKRLKGGGWLDNVEICFSDEQPRFEISVESSMSKV